MAATALSPTGTALDVYLVMVGFAFATLLFWRFWRFTLLPLIRPDEPLELPYWIPFIGHTISFFRDADKTLTYGRLYFNNKREPWGLTVAGAQIYIMTSANDVVTVYRNIEQLTFDDYIEDMMIHFGASKTAVHAMFTAPKDGDESLASTPNLQPNPLRKSLIHLAESFQRHQLHPGERFDVLQNQFLGSIDELLKLDSISPKAVLSDGPDRAISLLEWTRDVLLESATNAFFGPRLMELEPNLFQSFFYFDDHSWKLTYRIPRPWSNDMYAAKKVGQDALEAYFRLPKKDRPGATWLVDTLEAEMRARGLTEADLAAELMMIFWVINGNAYKLCFWLLTHLFFSPKLLSTVREEVTAAITTASSASPKSLADNLERCRHLNAMYYESLRIASSSMSVRNVLCPLVVGGKTLRKGTKVLVPYRQLHFDENVFGPNANVFDHTRFLNNKDLHRSPSFRPFGGGTTHCPGRFLAKREVLTFVALVLYRFDLQVVGKPGPSQKTESTASKSSEQNTGVADVKQPIIFPQIEDGKPCLGIMGPREGFDVALRVKDSGRKLG